MSESIAPYEASGLASSKPLDIATIKDQVRLIHQCMAEVMQNGHHYGTIPGTPKPTLYQPGAEKLQLMFHIGIVLDVEDLSGPDERRFRVTATATHRPTGEVLGSAVGEASTTEEKYHWRKALCDEEWQEAPESRRRIKWGKSKGGAIYKAMQIRTEPADLANTVLKMAAKRAEVAVTRRVTAASDIFTQDVEDLPEEVRQEVSEEENAPIKQPQAKKPAPTQETPRESEPEEGEKQILRIERGVVEQALEGKSGTSRAGKPWTLYMLLVSSVRMNTFDEGAYRIALDAKAAGQFVTVQYEAGEKGNNLVAIRALA